MTEDPHAITVVAVEGVIGWGTYRLTCPTCRADRGWRLCTQQPPCTAGEVAWAECVNGHRVPHPLVYPVMVHAVREWTVTPEQTRAPLQQVLAEITWQPHREDWGTDDLPSDMYPAVTYQPWSQDEAAARYYQRLYPDLLAAATAPANGATPDHRIAR